MQLSGRTAIVTGSTSGIGLAIATAFAQAGANVVVNGLGSEADNAVAIRQVSAAGTRVAFDRHITPALQTKTRTTGGGVAGVVSMRVCRWRTSGR